MDQVRWTRMQNLFDQVMPLNEAERTTFLDEQCSGDPQLRDELVRLISASERSEDFMHDAVMNAIASALDEAAANLLTEIRAQVAAASQE